MIRYMGTKRHMATAVHDVLDEVANEGPILDLFAGTGSVAETFADQRSVVLNDSAEFIGAILRPRFTGDQVPLSEQGSAAFVENFSSLRDQMTDELEVQLATEQQALAGSRDELERYMKRAQRQAVSALARSQGRAASIATGVKHYRLATLNYSAGYFSLAQAIEVDALRFAIDAIPERTTREHLLSCWILAASRVLNAPGHTAQFLKASSPAGHRRVIDAWGRSVWFAFESAQAKLAHPLGSKDWRSGNQVSTMDALSYLRSGPRLPVGVVYADPPYTRDQYGRFYHLYETLYKYDYPVARGAGRVRPDTFVSGFSTKTSVEWHMRELFRLSALARTPLVVSYPSSGLLTHSGACLREIAMDYFGNVDVVETSALHSTLGGSSGSRTISAVEQLVVCSL